MAVFFLLFGAPNLNNNYIVKVGSVIPTQVVALSDSTLPNNVTYTGRVQKL